MPQSPRLSFDIQGGLNTVSAPDELNPGSFAYLCNVRRLLGGRLTARPPLGANQLGSTLPSGPTSLVRMNDPYMGSPEYVLIEGAAGLMYVNASQVASGLSGNPISYLPYTPPQSPRPWCYTADPSMAVTVPAYSAYTGPVTGMLKVRADGTVYKSGIMEPQAAPGVSVSGGSGPNWVSYRYTYWSDEGAESNPSPESAPQTIPQSSDSGSEAAASGSTINPNITVNTAQYEGNSNEIRTKGSVAPGTVTDYIIARNFGLSVPAGVTIDGVQAAMGWLGQYAGTGIISGVALFYQGSIIGQVKAPGIQNSQALTTAIQGGNSDSWGSVLTPDVVNDSTFGIGFQITTAEASGSDRSFIVNFSVTVYYTTLSATATATSSTDPQVKSINFYRQTPGLNNFTFVGRVPNSAPSFTDTLTDLQVAANQQLSFANYEPFPSIDLPRKGTLTVGSDGACTWESGDVFNTRWLPGTIILIDNGSGSQVPYELYNRPTSTTAMKVYSTAIDPVTGFLTITFPPAGSDMAWEISAPTLAQQASPVIWGPTPDNAGSFYFGLDPLNPGDLVWSLGNNFDSAPDTNRMFVTTANEALQNGTVTSELSTVFSTDRFWLIYPNFADAVATVTGTAGQQWALVQSAATRGLYMRYAIGALGSLIGWRAKDGIALSQGGGPEKMISEQIYNLFPHGGQAPSPVTIAGQTIYPPDDTNVKAQTITLVPGYVFYNYQDTTGTPRTLVYDIEAKGWTVDSYTPTVNCHAWAVGDVFQILAGCTDGTVRALDSTGTESGTAIVATPSINGGSARTVKRIGGMFLRAAAAAAVTVSFWANRFQVAVTGTSPSTIGPDSGENDYLIDFTNAANADVQDVGMLLSFPIGSGCWLKEWQPDWTEIPELIAAWRTGMLSYGLDGWLHIPWLRFAYQSTTAVTLKLITDQGATATLTIPSSGDVPAKFFTWVPATVSGTSMKFRMLEWVADAGGTPFTVFSGDIEVAIKPWGSTQGYQTLRPFQKVSGIPSSTT